MSVRRVVVLAALGLSLLAAAYSLYWMHAAGQARDALEAWARARRAQGWTVEWQDVADRGFPLTLTLTLSQPAVTLPSGLGWRTEAMALSVSPLHPATLHVAVRGHQSLRWRDADWSLDLESLSLRLSERSLDAHAHGLSRVDGLAVADLALSVAPLPPRPDPAGHPATWRFALSVRDLDLPAALLDGFDRRLPLAEVAGRVRGVLPDAAPMAAIAAWSKQGGVVELDRVALDWPPLGLEGEGTAALDPEGQPLLALSARIRGFDGLLERLAGPGGLDPAAGRALKTVLTLMSKPDSRGRPAVAVPVSVQDGQLYLGPARLAPVPAIPWADFAAP